MGDGVVTLGVGGVDGVTSSFPGPVVLTFPAPTTPGGVTWSASWYGNNFDLGRIGGTTVFGPLWLDDPNNANHGDEIVIQEPAAWWWHRRNSG